jgi:hypothetical protein
MRRAEAHERQSRQTHGLRSQPTGSKRRDAEGESPATGAQEIKRSGDCGGATAQQGRSLISTRRRSKLQTSPAVLLVVAVNLAIMTASDLIAPVVHTPHMPEVRVFHLWETFEMRYRRRLLNRRRTTHPVWRR